MIYCKELDTTYENKEDLFKVFLETKNILSEKIIENNILLIKPLDDLIDAYFITQKLKSVL
jgi:hypothetical protein